MSTSLYIAMALFMVALKDELLAFSLIASFRSLGVVYNIPMSGEGFDLVTSFGVLKHLMFPCLNANSCYASLLRVKP